MADPHHTVVGFFITADRDVLALVVTVTALLSISAVAMLSRGRKWSEILSLFFVIQFALFVISYFLFNFVEVPFAKVDTVSITTLE